MRKKFLLTLAVLTGILLFAACAPAATPPSAAELIKEISFPIAAPLDTEEPNITLDIANVHMDPQPDCAEVPPADYVKDLGDYLVFYPGEGMILLLNDKGVDHLPDGSEVAFSCGSYDNGFYKFFLTSDGHLWSLDYAFQAHTTP